MNSNKGNLKHTSIILSVIILSILIFSGIVSAVDLYISSVSAQINESDNIAFRVYADIENGENIPVTALIVNISNVDNSSEYYECYFAPNGANSCDDFSIDVNSQVGYNYSSNRYGFGYGASTGYTNKTFGAGFGYGATAGYVYPVGELDYNISWKSAGVFQDTNFSINFYVVSGTDFTYMTENATTFIVKEVPVTLNSSIVVEDEKVELIVNTSSTTASNITLTENATDVTLNLSSGTSIVDNKTTVTLSAPISIVANVSVGVIEVNVPANLTINGSESWDGKIALPTPTTATVSVSGYTTSVTAAISLGDSSQKLVFDKAVRVKLGGVAGSGVLVGYIVNGSFTKIITTCSVDSQAWADENVTSECYMTSGSDIIIWTKHFTKFLTYTQSAVSTSSGSSSSSSTTLKRKCGNLICEFGESYLTCPLDCLAPVVNDTIESNASSESDKSTEIPEVTSTESQDSEVDRNSDKDAEITGNVIKANNSTNASSNDSSNTKKSSAWVWVTLLMMVLILGAVIYVYMSRIKDQY